MGHDHSKASWQGRADLMWLVPCTETALEAVQVNHVRGDLQGVAMFSDGLQMLALKMPGATPHAPFFTPLFRFMRGEPDPQLRLDQLQKLLQSPRISQRADDDLTLLLATLV